MIYPKRLTDTYELVVYPPRILEIASSPFGVDLDIGGFLLLQNPIMDKLGRQFLLQHTFDGLEIVGQVGAMHIGFLAQTHDGAHFFVALLVHHHKRCGDVSLLHRIDLLGNLGCKVLVLKACATRVRVGHHTCIHSGVLVLRIADNRLLKGYLARLDFLTDSIQPVDRIDLVVGTDARAKQDMAAVDTLAFFLNQLDNVVAVLGLHDTRHFLGVVEIERHISKLTDQLSTPDEAQFTATFG